MNKLNKVFANDINKKINNNLNVYYGSKDDVKEVENDIKESNDYSKMIEKNINQKIRDIFNSRNYIYKADVIITTKNGNINKRIIGKNSINLITNENELIPISDIIDIKVK